MNVRTVIMAAVAGGASIFGAVGAVEAAVLATDPAALSGFQGSQGFSLAVSPFSFQSTVEYAVYAPGAFSTSTALGLPTDPSGGSHYVYAYQIFNSGSPSQVPISELSVGLDGVTNSTNIGVIGGPSFGVNPSTSAFILGPSPTFTPTAAHWIFIPDIAGGLASNILLFTSPKAPQFFNSSVLAAPIGAQHSLPSPIPEPTSIMVLGGLALFAMNTMRPARKSD